MNKKLLRKKLALMLSTLKKKRKFFCEVEYLESTGTQWIDTGVNVDTSTDEIKLYFQLTDTALYKWFFGEYDTNARLGLGSGDGADKRNFLYQQSATKVSDAQMYDKQHLFEINSDGGFLDGTKIRDYLSFASTSSIYLFNLNIDSPSDYRCKSKIWKYEHKRNGVLVRDMIPVLDWNYAPCMYDKVSGQLFYNKGTGDFLYGREIHYVDYLESTGTQYIDTGVSYFADYEIGIQLRENVSNKALGNGSFNCMQRQNVTNPNWQFTSNNSSWNSTTRITEYHVIKWKDGKIYSDDVLIQEKEKAVGTTDMYLYSVDRNNKYPNVIYFCKLWNPTDGTLVRDYIPAIDENGVGFMFDKVTHTIYDNAGTGYFKYPAREVEYLQSSGTQYIDLGFKVDDSYGYKVDYAYLTADDRVVLGTKGSGDSRWCLSGNHNPNVNMSWNTSYGSAGLGLNKRQVVQMNYLNDRKRFLNEVEKTPITTTLDASASSYNICMFAAIWGGGAANLFSTAKVYSAQISKGTDVFRDFIPVFQDGQAGMLDKQNNVFYPNVGTGTFTTGKIIESEWE